MSVDWRRHDALGELRVLSDDIICRVLGKLEVQDVTRLACVSSVLYIFCNEEPLWMRLCMSEPPETAIVYKGTWRQTALTRLAEVLKVTPPNPQPPRRFEGFVAPQPASSSPSAAIVLCGPFWPMRQKLVHRASLSRRVRRSSRKANCPLFLLAGFSSLHLYRQWYRCHIDLHTFSFEAGHVHRIANVSVSQFFQKHDGKKPLLLTDLLSSWPASESWTLPKLVTLFGDVKFKVSQAHGKAVKMSLRNYAAYASVQHDEEPLYIFDPNFGESAPPLLSDYQVPPLFGEDFLALLSKDLRPPYRWLVLGPPRSGAGWHVDPSLTSAWNALLTGKKRWAFYPPGKVPPGVTLRISEEDGDISFDGPPSLQWWLDVYPHIKPEDRPLECTQLAGETIFVPSGWWHCVLNIEDSIAVTQNFMNEANFEMVLCDLAPGFHHRGLSRAGGLAQKRSGHPFPDHSLSSADTAYQHFSNQSEDYISKQALRELLRKMWDTKPKLRNRLWKCACKTVGADYWHHLLGLICKRHRMETASRGECLPLSGGRNAVSRVGSRIVKVFISEKEDESRERLEKNAGDASVNGQKINSCSNDDILNENASEKEEGNCRLTWTKDCEKATDSGRGQEEMFRTEVQLHELIRTSKSPLQDAVPALFGHGVVSEKENGELVLQSKADFSSAEENGQLRKCFENGGGQSKLSNGPAKTLESPEAARKKRKTGSSSKNVAVNDVTADEEKRRWLYVISEDCGGRQLGEVYDSLSKEELLELAGFLGRQVALIQALPLPNERLRSEGAAPSYPPAKEDPNQVLPANAKRRKLENGHQVDTEAQRSGTGRGPVAQLPSPISQQVLQPANDQSAAENRSEPSPSKQSDSSIKSRTSDKVEHAEPPPSAELPSLEELGVPPKWRSFAAFLRAQREDLTERLSDLGLPKPLLETVEAYVPKDPVDLLAFEKDPVWLHTDLLPDNILVKPLEGSVRKENHSMELKKGRGNEDSWHANGNGHANEKEAPNGVQSEKSGTFTGAHILDFADARIGDPLYEIASLHLGTFRGDSQLLAAFLGAAPFDFMTEAVHHGNARQHCHKVTEKRHTHTLSYRAMCYTVLHEINLLHILLQHRPSALTDCPTWQQLSNSLWSKLDREDPERVM